MTTANRRSFVFLALTVLFILAAISATMAATVAMVELFGPNGKLLHMMLLGAFGYVACYTGEKGIILGLNYWYGQPISWQNLRAVFRRQQT